MDQVSVPRLPALSNESQVTLASLFERSESVVSVVTVKFILPVQVVVQEQTRSFLQAVRVKRPIVTTDKRRTFFIDLILNNSLTIILRFRHKKKEALSFLFIE